MGWFKRIEAIVDPMFQLLRPIPPWPWIPLSLLWFGTASPQKIFVIWLSAFVPCVINAYTGIRLTEPLLVKAAMGLGVKRPMGSFAGGGHSLCFARHPRRRAHRFGSAWMTLVAADFWRPMPAWDI